MKATYMTREEWGASSIPRRGVFVAADIRKGLVAHHSVGGKVLSFSVSQALSYVRWLQTGVADRLGADIPYSFVPCLVRSGNEFELIVCEGRGWFRSGAHTVDTIADDDPVEDENKSLLATGWQGDWRTYQQVLSPYGDPDTILDDAVTSLGRLLGEMATVEIPEHGIEYRFGHRDFKLTSCPSDALYARVELLFDSFQEGADMAGFGFETEAERDYFAELYRESELHVDTDGENAPTHPASNAGQAVLPRSWREFAESNRFFFDGLGVDLRDDAAVKQLGVDIAAAVVALREHTDNHSGDSGTWVPTEAFAALITPTA